MEVSALQMKYRVVLGVADIFGAFRCTVSTAYLSEVQEFIYKSLEGGLVFIAKKHGIRGCETL